MAAKPARVNFTHTRTVRLVVDETTQLDSLSVAKSLPDFIGKIVGVVPQFGGKCFDITLDSTESATQLAHAGFDYLDAVMPLRLLGQKTLHVSVYVPIEFPDAELVKLLTGYGTLKSNQLRRLHFKEEGFEHLENGIRVAEFVQLARDLPRKIVIQGLEIYFKYTGQPVQCYRCNSSEHVVKNCPKQRRIPATLREQVAEAGGVVLPPAPIPEDNTVPATENQEAAMDLSTPEEPATATSQASEASSPAPTRQSYAQVTQELFPPTAPVETVGKRPPSSPGKAANTAAKKPATSTSPKARKQLVLDEPQADNPFLNHFMVAIKKAGPSRVKLMNVATGSLYYHWRGLYLQHLYGNFADTDPKNRRALKDREETEWADLHRILPSDAYAKLLRFSEELRREHPALFTSKS